MKNAKIPIEKRVENYYPKYQKYAKLGQRPPFFDRLFKPCTIAGCKMHDLRMKENETQRQVLENMQEMAFRLRLEWEGNVPKLLVDWVSPAYERILGFAPDSAIGKDIMKNVHPDDRQAVLKILYEKVKNKEGGVAKFRSVREDDTYVWVEGVGTPILNDEGEVTGGVIVSRDITRRVETEIKLAGKSEELFEIFVNSPIAIEIFDKNGKLTKINPSCLGLFGLEHPSDVIGFDLFSDPNLSERMRADIRAGKSVRYAIEFDFSKVPYKTSETGIKHLEVHVGSMKNVNGTGYIVQIVDISNFKEVEGKLKAAEEVLRKANADLARLLSIVLHDVRNPVGTIRGFAEFLMEGATAEQSKQWTEVIYKLSKRALEVVEQVTAWRNAGSITVKPSKFDIFTVVDDNVAMVQANSKGVKILNDIERGKMMVFADEKAVSQIIQNLVANAVKFTPSGGVVRISAMKNDNNVEVSVFDTGVGIPPESVKRLFKFEETFTTNGTDGEEGTGLGLTAVHELVGKNGGKIWVESTVGIGTAFTFTLPAMKST